MVSMKRTEGSLSIQIYQSLSIYLSQKFSRMLCRMEIVSNLVEMTIHFRASLMDAVQRRAAELELAARLEGDAL